MKPKKKSASRFILPIFIGLLAIYLAFQGAIAYEAVMDDPTRIGSYEQFNLLAFIENFEVRLATQPLTLEWTEQTPKALMLMGFICLLLAMWAYSTRRKFIDGKEYGTSEWATPKEISHLWAENILKVEIRKIRLKSLFFLFPQKVRSKIAAAKVKYENADAIFTKTERICIYNREVNNNTLIIGGSGSGKTRGYVVPNALQAHSSYVFTDPKGEIYQKTAYFFKKMGYAIRVLNLYEKKASDWYNCFKYIHRERDDWQDNVLTLIETIIANTDGGQEQQSSDPFWPKAERLFLQSIFYFVAEAFPPEEMNINTVLKLIEMLKLEEEHDNKDSDLDIMFQLFAKKYGDDHIAVKQFNEFRGKASGKTAKSIVVSAVARFAPFRISEISRIVSDDTLCFDTLGKEKTVVYVIVPPTEPTFNFIAGMAFTQMFAELNYCATVENKNNGMQLPVQVRFILDEYANTCVIPNFVKTLAYARSLGIGITIILQSLEQLKKMHKDEWGVIIDNCATMLFLGGVRNKDTLEYLSSILGKGTYDKKDYSRSRGRSSGSNVSYQRVGRELMDTAELQKLPKKNCILFVTGKNPSFSEKYDMTEHPNYKYTSDADAGNFFEYKPRKKFDPHSEELSEVGQQEFTVPAAELIHIDFDQQTALQFMENNITRMEIDNVPFVDGVGILEEGEEFINDLLAEEQSRAAAAQQLYASIAAEAIQVHDTPIAVAKSIISMLKEGEVVLDNPAEAEERIEVADVIADFAASPIAPPTNCPLGQISEEDEQELAEFAAELSNFDFNSLVMDADNDLAS